MNVKITEASATKVGKAMKRAAPTILTCIGSAGVVITAVLSARDAPKASAILERRKAELCREKAEKRPVISLIDRLLLTWKCYIPAAAAAGATIACIFGSNILNRRQQASLIGAYAFISNSFREYRDAVKELYGEEGHARVMERIMIEKAQPPTIINSLTGESFDFGVTDEEKQLFYDAFSQRFFEAKISDVLLAELHVNRNFAIGGGEVSLRCFYDFLGLDTPNELKDLAWYSSDYYYFVDFTHTKHCIDDGPEHEQIECWVIDMPYPPTLEPLEEA